MVCLKFLIRQLQYSEKMANVKVIKKKRILNQHQNLMDFCWPVEIHPAVLHNPLFKKSPFNVTYMTTLCRLTWYRDLIYVLKQPICNCAEECKQESRKSRTYCVRHLQH